MSLTRTEVPEALSPPPGNPRFPLFDGLRAAAAIGVLVGHVASSTGEWKTSLIGQIGVDLQIGVAVFFGISGFLLYRPFVAADLASKRRPDLKSFYRRRVLRIVPGYWVALTILAIAIPIPAVFSSDWWHYYFLIQNFWGLIDTGGYYIKGMGQAWTLSIEASFYLALPFYAMLIGKLSAGKKNRRIKLDIGILIAMAIISFWLRKTAMDSFLTAPQQHTSLGDSLVGALPYGGLLATLPLSFLWFSVGMLMAVASAAESHRKVRPRFIAAVAERPGLVWLGALAVFMTMVLGDSSLAKGEHPSHYILQAIVASLFIFPAAFTRKGGSGLPARILAHRWIVWLGLVSYGIYLWHNGLLELIFNAGILPKDNAFLILTVLLLATTIPVAAISYYLVESPFLRFKEARKKTVS